jgi:glycosyltransferase involved in cell wall biosynthesis
MTRSDRVLVVSHGFQSHYELGFVNGLAENGLRVVLLGSDTTIAARLHPRVELRNIRGSQDPGRPRWRKVLDMLRYHVRLLAAAVRLRGMPVVCIGLLDPEWVVGVAEGWWLRWWSGSYAIVVHNALPHNDHSEAQRRVYRLIYRIADWLLVHTETTRAELVGSFGVPAQRVLTVPHGLNDAVVPSSLTREQAKLALGLSPQRRTVLFFGVTSHYKGTDLLLDALDRLPDVCLLMAGRSGAGSFCERLRERLPPLVAAGRAWWRDGFLADDEIGPAFAAADAVVLPYRHIDQSGVLLLALTLGVPVLATPVGGLADLIDARNGRVIPAPSVEAVAATIEAFFAAPAPSAESVRSTVAHLAWRQTLASYVRCIAPPPLTNENGTRGGAGHTHHDVAGETHD